MNRHAFTFTLIPASLAVHLLVAACGGSEGTSQAGPGAGGSGGGSGAGGAASVTTGAGVTTGSATTGAGSGGNVPECMCAPKPPVVYVVDCAPDAHGNLLAEVSLPGATLDQLASVNAIGTFSQANDQLGSVVYSGQRAVVLVADGHAAVNCKWTVGMAPYSSVRFVVPAQ